MSTIYNRVQVSAHWKTGSSEGDVLAQYGLYILKKCLKEKVFQFQFQKQFRINISLSIITLY
jgi:hypothetical protein